MPTQTSSNLSRRRITMSDIAVKAGVAVSTVSSALHDTGRIGEEQRQRIRDLAREMGYRPKLAAQLHHLCRLTRSEPLDKVAVNLLQHALDQLVLALSRAVQ